MITTYLARPLIFLIYSSPFGKEMISIGKEKKMIEVREGKKTTRKREEEKRRKETGE